ncbi:MAG TPA: TOBE domain-containing protein, partial [Candidatus Binatia bacterium]|nr:TOBE domain-containing protein [Candidatus Binatia bacterium]
ALVRLDGGDACRIGGTGREVGQVVDVSLRPESVTIAAADEAAPVDSLSGSVSQSAYLGNAMQYQVVTTGGVAMTVLAPKSAARLDAGSAVSLAWRPTEALVLGDRPAGMEEMA